jgi:diguanylate cyclase (GGDEF)-like protein/PAS domain S-box-containing protein
MAEPARHPLLALVTALQETLVPERVVDAFCRYAADRGCAGARVWTWDPAGGLLTCVGGRDRRPPSPAERALLERHRGHAGGTPRVVALRAGGRTPGLVELPAEAAGDPAWLDACELLAYALANALAHQAMVDSEALMRSLIEQVPAVTYAARPISGDPIYISPQLDRLFGVPASEWLGGMDGWASQIHPDDRDETLRTYLAAIAACEPFEREYRLLDAAGGVHWVWDMAVTLRDDAGAPLLVEGVILDVSNRKRAEQAFQDAQAHLQGAEERYRNLVERLPLAIYIDALDASATSIYNSPQNAEITGYTHEQWLSDPDLFAKIVHADDRERVLRELHEAHAQNTEFCCEYRIVRPDGSERWVRDQSVVIDDADGTPIYRQGYLLDITPRKAAEDRLAHLAYHDSLTGLPNRAMFGEHLEVALARAERASAALAVLFVDLDDFKLVNDSFGHGAGDQLLCAVADRLRRAVRPSDVVARQGGDEFLILLADLDPAEGDDQPDALGVVRRVATELLEALREPVSVLGTDVYCSGSIGVSMFPGDATNAETLLKHADIAMYRAKEAGRHAFHVYTQDGGEPIARLSLAGRLARAIERDELVLHYQPLIELATKRMVGCEALIRWQHGDTLVPPGEFIPLAERTGLIGPISNWVIAEACRQSAEWNAAGLELYVSVNLPAVFWEPTAMRRLLATIEAFGLSPERMMIELTESAVMANPAQSKTVMQQLHERGLRLAIDDFGTGHSSLGRLHQMSVTTLKIDRSFITDLPGDRGAAVLVTTMVRLAESLGLHALAEGIETPEQLAFLEEVGCPLGQGFLFSRPVPAEQITQIARRPAA